MDCWTERESVFEGKVGAVRIARMRAVFLSSDFLMRSRTSLFVMFAATELEAGDSEFEFVNCGSSNLFETSWIPVFTGMTGEVGMTEEKEEEKEELRLEEVFLIVGRLAAVSEDVSVRKSPLTKSPTGEKMEEKMPAVCLGMLVMDEMTDW